MAHHTRYPRRCSRALPESLRRAIRTRFHLKLCDRLDWKIRHRRWGGVLHRAVAEDRAAWAKLAADDPQVFG